MNRVFSARLDEAVVLRIDRLARTLKISRKSIVESAVSQYADQLERRGAEDVFEATSGAWQRREKPEVTVKKARRAFQASFERGKQ